MNDGEKNMRSNQDTLQWFYGLLQQQRASHEKIENSLIDGKVIPAYIELNHCKTAVDIQLSQLFMLAERLGIAISTYPYKKTIEKERSP